MPEDDGGRSMFDGALVDSGLTNDGGEGTVDGGAVDAGGTDGSTSATGHVVLIGHPCETSSLNEDRILGQSVFLSGEAGDLDVLIHTEFTAGIPTVVDAAHSIIETYAASIGRGVTIENLDNYFRLPSALEGKEVFVVLTMRGEFEATIDAIGRGWAETLNEFVDRGGVLIVLTSTFGLSCSPAGCLGTASRILEPAGFMTGVRSVTGVGGQPLVVVDAADPIAAGVLPYAATGGSACFSGSAGGAVVVHTRDTFCPVVRHLTR